MMCVHKLKARNNKINRRILLMEYTGTLRNGLTKPKPAEENFKKTCKYLLDYKQVLTLKLFNDYSIIKVKAKTALVNTDDVKVNSTVTVMLQDMTRNEVDGKVHRDWP